MVLSYIPYNINHFYDLMNLYCEITNINNPKEQKDFFLELLDNRFCKHFIKKGNNKGKPCLRKHKNDGIYCNSHMIKYQEKNKKCLGITKYGKSCLQKVKSYSDFCYYHKKKNIINNTKTYNCNIIFKQLFLIEKSYGYQNSLVKKKHSFIDIYIFLKKHNVSYSILLYTIFLIIKMTSQNQNNLRNGWDYDNNQQIVLYEHKENYPIIFFNNIIYTYINKYRYNKFMKYLKKIYVSNLSEIINYEEIQKKKKYLKNKKKRLKLKEKRKLKKCKPDLSCSYSYIKTNCIKPNVFEGIIAEESINLKDWPVKYDYYKDKIPYNINYFHCFINIKNEDSQKVILFYYKNDKINHIKITYKELYDLLLKEYNSESVYKFIKNYYKKFNITN